MINSAVDNTPLMKYLRRDNIREDFLFHFIIHITGFYTLDDERKIKLREKKEHD